MFSSRSRVLQLVVMLLLVGIVLRLSWLQVARGAELSEKAEVQRTRIYVDPPRRGSILDRNGANLAFTLPAKSLTISPNRVRLDAEEPARWNPKNTVDKQLAALAQDIHDAVATYGGAEMAEKVKTEDIIRTLNEDSDYEVLIRNVDPDIATLVARDVPEVAADRQDIRQYPNGAIGENIIGRTEMSGAGQFGLEASADAKLAGNAGKRKQEVSVRGQVIPGSLEEILPVTNGSSLELTIDIDLQTYVQQQLEQATANSGAKSASAVVLDARDGTVLAMANSGTVNPNGDVAKQLEEGKSFTNESLYAAFEPGSVAKIVTAAAAIEDKLTTPDEVLQVPGQITLGSATVSDAWEHGVVPYTTTGVFGKSSNVGTLMLAQRVGEDRFADILRDFGVGQPTGLELPGENSGFLPPRDQWSGGTFANLPIGQGFSLNLVQMASMYQTVANDGVRVEPRIIKKVISPDGTETIPEPAPKHKVISPETASTLRSMFQAVTQKDPTGVQQGTGPGAAVEGYQIAGKTGTAQQIDPNCKCYSNSDYWITFAGIAPADDPRYVIALMLDDPERGVHGEGGQTAAPLFHDIASWLLDRDNVPLSPPPSGKLILQAQ
ncbi:cell division protein FtsI [Corynebacterium sp. 13CS0277]|uniref:peptidoglycan D,D-transpeptidase FtsI family protein n=1 Tax=Corynebacterium sp. 13CS0277 TaxID=2071994 RepID=UPI000D026E96|nr:penicillin-binding protein 2 [Corynebacterium sp. 13CS0277]PRQ11177.1 cell division protein FtsI [Corynebacterium sp. 13CS0277]